MGPNKKQGHANWQRSQEVSGPVSKRAKVLPGRSFAHITKERIMIRVFNKGNTDRKIPKNQWAWVEGALAVRCFELITREPGPPPVCKDVGWYQGNNKVIACDDVRSVELYRAAIASVGEVYPGARLIKWSEVQSRPQARIWIPALLKESHQVLMMLQRCNTSLPTQDWRVVEIEAS
ncbi:uncharacterized protein LOC116806414 [Drosophila grimshawi]|uniref:uncharacterized protein LOC116806414 n=1 Tax=Drosophila grimshawi TaxID=7222 RepID=UPI001C933015|nr:uncharacterized protein LOC116806414 [Drosophila grimshawi]